MADIPADFGVDRLFAVDPENTSLATMIGDLSVLFLQNLLVQRQNAGDDAERAILDAQINGVRQVLDNSNACQTREQSIRNPKTVTLVSDLPFGVNDNIANVRIENIPIFTGSKTDSVNVLQWISRILNLAESMKLTFNATVNLLILSSNQGATNFILEMKQENKSLHEIVQNLEMRYLPNLEIEEECFSLERENNENIYQFFDRLKLVAKIECKDEPDDVLRVKSVENLVIENIHRVLTPSVRIALEERKMNRSLFGLPSFTSRELVSECYFLEKKFELKNSLF
jgi:hypothetical protein